MINKRKIQKLILPYFVFGRKKEAGDEGSG